MTCSASGVEGHRMPWERWRAPRPPQDSLLLRRAGEAELEAHDLGFVRSDVGNVTLSRTDDTVI